jgi:TIR domain
VTPGANYGEAIIRAIEETATTLLLLSAHSNASIHVTHEVERATSKRKRLIPIRLEDVQPGPALELHLATAQWVDAWRLSPDQVAEQLALVKRQLFFPLALTHRIGDQKPIIASRGCYQTSEAHDVRQEDQQADQERAA